MSENNADEKEILGEQVNNEEVMEKTNEIAIEETVTEEDNEVIQEQPDVKKIPFLNSLSAVISDEAIIGIISLVLLYLGDFLLKYAGYAITQKVSMLFIIFVVVSVLYTSISEATKSGKTLGKKFFNA